MELTVEVIGMKAFKGKVQNEFIDSGKLYTRTKLNERNNRTGELFSKGEVTEEWKLPNAEAVFRMQHIPMPFTARLEVERVSNGKEAKEIVMEVRPVDAATLSVLPEKRTPAQVQKAA
jgi:hypothetical protein